MSEKTLLSYPYPFCCDPRHFSPGITFLIFYRNLLFLFRFIYQGFLLVEDFLFVSFFRGKGAFLITGAYASRKDIPKGGRDANNVKV